MNGELRAAAAHLAFLTGDGDLVARIKTMAAAQEGVAATTALSTALAAALNAPPPADGGGDATKPAGGSDLEGCVQVLLSLVKTVCAMDAAVVTHVARSLSGGDGAGSLRLRSMALLYNSVPEQATTVRYGLLLDTIRLAARVGRVDMVADSVVPQLGRYIQAWGLSKATSGELYGAAYDALAGVGGGVYAAAAFDVNFLRLKTLNGGDDAALDAARAPAMAAIAAAVGLPTMFRFDTLLELDAVTRLRDAGDGAAATLFRLLDVFVNGVLPDWTSFVGGAGVAAALAGAGVDVDAAVHKMRLLSLTSLGLDSQQLTYDAIAAALDVPAGEVEEWVIRAIGLDLIDAKMNQLDRTVAVHRSTQRSFSKEEWRPLSERINVWKENVAELMITLAEARNSRKSPFV
ncbi:hypothetical protein BU14_0138s0015 [Porphyra umbilicalis]|uniref:Eukaryotic translation initiation factor 3 subunit M n=1 Tax=Porphyra umbilicalis TaxID=2786 RepID=A0A1X6P9T8_PORUM|nr:hypothetical protein BU14_0138s0015 [Porphyra umbilicalis]|eukprot:OSX77669.1 hypothetical protein BU14_0138s0015 [Porphyra umbilicalis]